MTQAPTTRQLIPGVFEVGDIVTRDGTDLHRVVEVNHPADDLIVVECIKEPLGYLQEDGVTRDEPWTRIGERETNLARRYEHAGHLIDGDATEIIGAITDGR